MNSEQKTQLGSVEMQLASAKNDLESIRDELQDEYEDLDEKHQELPIGEKLSTEIASLEDIINMVDDALADVQGFDLPGEEIT